MEEIFVCQTPEEYVVNIRRLKQAAFGKEAIVIGTTEYTTDVLEDKDFPLVIITREALRLNPAVHPNLDVVVLSKEALVSLAMESIGINPTAN